MTLPIDELAERLGRYLSERDGVPTRVSDVARIPGGASRETYRLKATQGEATRGMILRRDPESSLIDTDRATEYAAYAAAFRSGVIPVPEPLVLEESNAPLGRPFSLTAEIAGCETNVQLLAPALLPKVAEQKWSILGRLAALDVDALGLGAALPRPRPEDAARHELDYWAGVIAKDALHPQPIAEAAIRWLRRNLPPAPPKLALVHGDYRSGNFLFDAAGEIRGVLDWEMAHVGDPLEDLGWSLDPLWAWPDRHLAGRLAPRLEAIRIFERASGLKVDLDVFRGWEVFAALKAAAIWVSSAEDFQRGAAKEPILGAAGWLTLDRQNRILVDRLSPSSRRVYTEALAR
jgi:aminoglycoside phosphotransferase (APT) family kinase protein